MFESRPTQIWLALLGTSLALELAALFFQYQLDYGPCILCVQIRAVLLLVIVLAAVALTLHFARKLLSLGLLPCTLTFAWFCYQVLGIERGWFEGSCTFEPPFPVWIPLHEWLPSVFEPWELCGYTPDIILGITMAEILVALSLLYVVANIWLLRRAFQ